MDSGQLKRFIPRVLMMALALTAALVALRFALRGLDLRSFQEQLHRLNWRWLALAVVFDVMSYVAQGVRWQWLLDAGNVWHTTRAIYVGLFVNEIVPFRPGEAIRAWLVSRDLKIGLWNVLPTVVPERLMDGVWLTTALLGVSIIAPLPPGLVRATWVLAAILAAVSLAAWWRRGKGLTFLASVKVGLHNRRAHLASGGFLVAQGLAFWSVGRASHLSTGIAGAFVVMLIVRIGTMIPVAPANVGTHQFSTVLALSLFGITRPEAGGFSIVVFTVLTLPLLVIGFCACVAAGVTWRDIQRSVAQVAEPAAP